MQLALGVLGWQPEVFWKSTIVELNSAIEGFQEREGIDQDSRMSYEEFEELSEKIPDKPGKRLSEMNFKKGRQ